MNAMTPEQREGFPRRGGAFGYKPIHLPNLAQTFEGPTGYARMVEPRRFLSEDDVQAIERQIRKHEADYAAGQIPERPAVDPDAPNPVAQFYDELNEAARRAAEYERSSEGRSDRTLALLTEIRDLLSQQVRR